MPRLLDLFCGAGGSAVGYHRAGFDEIVGVDIKPQPNYPYPFQFIQGDALSSMVEDMLNSAEWDLVHASPPCQAYSIANNIHQKEHPTLIEPTRQLLKSSGRSYVIENVPGAPLLNPYLLCGLALGVNVKRHRLFETSFPLLVPPCPKGHPGDWLLVFGHTVLERGKQIGRTEKGGPIIRRRHVGTDRGREAMGIDWMTRDELSEAIPPAYCQFIGEQFLQQLAAECRHGDSSLAHTLDTSASPGHKTSSYPNTDDLEGNASFAHSRQPASLVIVENCPLSERRQDVPA